MNFIQKYQKIVDYLSDIIIEIDNKGIIKYVNPQIFRTIRYKPEDLINTEFKKIIHVDDTHKVLENIINTSICTDVLSTEFRLLHHKKYYIPVIASFFKSSENENKKILVLIRDVTKEESTKKFRKTGETFETVQDELDNNYKFITKMIHELKTPLNFINSASTLLLDNYKDKLDERADRLIETINSSGLRLKKLIENLINISQIESGKLKLKIQEANITELLDKCLNDMRYLIEENNLNLKYDFNINFYANVDKLWFTQVLTNLISNAINYTPVNGEISINIEKYKHYLDIMIKDTGVGFTEAEKKILFKMFSKIIRDENDVKNIIEGTGLGLFLSKEIIELHGGKIWVESEGRNKGSNFIIRLPFKSPC